jgi:26S proteasome non-ATPase regulatory subunit 9
MTAQQMFESSLKEAQLLIKQKESLEEQIETQEQILRSQNVGMKTPLVDSEGFPRSDLDIYKIRNARSILAPLYNDLKGKMEEIHRAMEIVHSYSHEKSTMEVKPIELKVFAKINGVAPDSPAYNGGLLRGDLVLKYL